MRELESTLAELRTLIVHCQTVAQISHDALQQRVAANLLTLLWSIEADILGLLQRVEAVTTEREAALIKIAADFKSVRDYLEQQATGKPH